MPFARRLFPLESPDASTCNRCGEGTLAVAATPPPERVGLHCAVCDSLFGL